MPTVKVTTIGESIGIAIPPEIAVRLPFSSGDEVEISETETGFQVTCRNGHLADQLQVAESVMQRRSEVLRKLAE